MGHTNYWSFGPFINEQDYNAALTDCRKIIKASPVPLSSTYRSTNGPRLRNGFCFNGVLDEGCEDFYMNQEPDRDTWFCKTREYEYDLIVIACLCALQDRLGKNFETHADGDPHEWEEGLAFARKVLGREVAMPQDQIDQVGKVWWWAAIYRAEHPEYAYSPLDVSHPDQSKEPPEYAQKKLDALGWAQKRQAQI